MSNADTDARTYLQHVVEFASNASTVRLYISRNDDRLNASAFAHGGFERLGEPGPLLEKLAQVKGQTVIDITDADTGHEIPFPIVAAMHANNESLVGPAFTLEKCEPGYLCLKKTISFDPGAEALPPRKQAFSRNMECCRQHFSGK